MGECIAVDPNELRRRSEALRAIRTAVTPTEARLRALTVPLGAVGAGWAFLGATFTERWLLTLAHVGGVLDDVATRLDRAAVTYEAYEELLAEALGE